MFFFAMIALALNTNEPSKALVTNHGEIERLADAFGALPATSRLDVSPDGRYLARRVVYKGEYALRIDPLGDAGKPVLWAPADEASLGSFSWTSDNELIVISEKLAVTRARSIAPKTHRSTVYYDFFQAKRPRVMRPDGKTVTELTFKKLGDIRSFWPLGNTELMASDMPVFISTENASKYGEVFRPAEVSLEKNTYDFLAPPTKAAGVFTYSGDPTGQVMVAKYRDFGAASTTLYRRTNRRWQKLNTDLLDRYDITRVLDAKTLIVRDRNGSLYTYDVDADTRGEALYVGSDAAWAVMAPGTSAVIGVRTGGDDGEMLWRDPAEAARHAAAEDAIGEGEVFYRDASHDGVVRVLGGAETEVVYSENGGILKRYSRWPSVAEFDEPKVRTVTYSARDGIEIEGYLSHASDADPAAMPLVVMPHGGPAARDTRGYDAWRSYLTSLGYAVFQPNFRGSTGYGAEFRDAGVGEWGAAMQTDLTDGVRYLVANGLADKSRLAIMGGSYGGYAALMGALDETPYVCAASINGVTDLNGMLDTEQISSAFDYWAKHIGGDGLGAEELSRRSPLARAAEIDIPVLLIHGVLDTTVRKGQSAALESAMKEAGGDVTAVYLDRSDHYLDIEDERQRAFRETGKFLSNCFG